MQLPPLKVIWLASPQPCGKLRAATLPDWVSAYQTYHPQLAPEVRASLLAASLATLAGCWRRPARSSKERTIQGLYPIPKNQNDGDTAGLVPQASFDSKWGRNR